MSKKFLREIIRVSGKCVELICCDTLVPSLRAEGIWVLGYSNLSDYYEIYRKFENIHILVFTVSGSGLIWNGTKFIELKTGEWVFIPIGQLVHYKILNSDIQWDICWFLINRKSSFVNFDSISFGSTSEFNQLARIIESLHHEQSIINSNYTQELLVKSLSSVLVRAVNCSKPNPLTVLYNAFLQDLSESWTIDKMAKFINVSESKLQRLSLEHWGTSPRNFYDKILMKYASMFLSTSDISIKEISIKLGFSNQYNFSRSFKEHFSMSPRQYRLINNPMSKGYLHETKIQKFSDDL
jgi:AraC family transcriptional activator of mtrCDE